MIWYSVVAVSRNRSIGILASEAPGSPLDQAGYVPTAKSESLGGTFACAGPL